MEAALGDDPPSAAAVARARAAIAAALGGAAPVARAQAAGARVVASGGTATALAALDLSLGRYDGRRVHGHVLDRTGLGALDPVRAAILPAGALVLAEVVRAAGAAAVTVSDHGVRHAYLRERLGP